MNQPEKPLEKLTKDQTIRFLRSIDSQVTTIRDFHQKHFEGDEATTKKVANLTSELKDDRNELNPLLSQTQNEQKRVSNLNEQAEELFLNVSSGKLAYSFQRLKQRYGSDRLIDTRGFFSIFYSSFCSFSSSVIRWRFSYWESADLQKHGDQRHCRK